VAWSMALGRGVQDAMYPLAAAILDVGRSLILESAYHRSFARPQFERLLAGRTIDVVEVYCETSRAERNRRFQQRTKAERHPGHNDDQRFNPDAPDDPERGPLEIGRLIRVDTTQADPSYEHELAEIVRQLG
jgi:predicted kinase